MSNQTRLRLEGTDYDRDVSLFLRHHQVEGDQAFHFVITGAICREGEDRSGSTQMLYKVGPKQNACLY